jgi:hypothetical protein
MCQPHRCCRAPIAYLWPRKTNFRAVMLQFPQTHKEMSHHTFSWVLAPRLPPTYKLGCSHRPRHNPSHHIHNPSATHLTFSNRAPWQVQLAAVEDTTAVALAGAAALTLTIARGRGDGVRTRQVLGVRRPHQQRPFRQEEALGQVHRISRRQGAGQGEPAGSKM